MYVSYMLLKLLLDFVMTLIISCVLVHVVIRKYQPSDHKAVISVFRDGILEHIYPTFTHAISQPLHITLTVCIVTVGYILGGSSVATALLAGGSWIGLVYFCSYDLYAAFVRLKLATDMQDIVGYYLSDPDNCFWVAEADINGQPQVVGMVAVEAKKLPDGQKYGELFRMIVSSACRGSGLGSRLCKTAENFCKERGFTKLVLETSSTQKAAVALYLKMGFSIVHIHRNTHIHRSSWWVIRLTRVSILYMEKEL